MNVRLEFRHTLLFILSGWDFPIEPKWMNERGKEVEKLNFSVVSRWYEEVLLSPSSWLMRIKYLMQMQNCRLGSSDDVSKYQHCACLENLNRIVYIFQRHAKKDSSWRHKRGIFDEIITAHESQRALFQSRSRLHRFVGCIFFTHLYMLLDTWYCSSWRHTYRKQEILVEGRGNSVWKILEIACAMQAFSLCVVQS